MTNKKNILLLLLIPPPFGGGEIQGKHIGMYFENNSDIRCLTFSRKWANKSTQGRISLRNILYGFYYIIRVFKYLIIDRPRVIYFSIPKNLAAYLRMIPIIYIADFFRIKIYGELAGTSFDFLSNSTNELIFSFSLHSLQKFSSIRFLGKTIAKKHLGYSFNRPICFSNGVELPPKSNSLKVRSSFEQNLSLLYVGELSKSKGIMRIISALNECKKSKLLVSCTFLGEWRHSSTNDEVLKLIRVNELEKYCHFEGLQKGDDKWKYFANSHILVHPTDLDGQPLSILEAIGSGLAIISTKIGAIPDTIVEDFNGYLMNKIDFVSLYSLIKKLYDDRDTLERIRRNNLKSFNKDYSLKAYLDNNKTWLYSEIAKVDEHIE